MATLYITEYERGGSGDFGGGIQAPLEPALVDQTVNIDVTSTQSSTLNSETRLIGVSTDTTCHIDIGTNPTATTSKRRLPADVTAYYAIPNATEFKVAVIQG